MFLPLNKSEAEQLSWDELDIIFVSGDCYIDSPHIGVALLGKWLVRNGFRVGIVAQPRLDCPDDILQLGRPRLFWGVTGGSVDSMVANYTALKKHRRSDDYTPGGINNSRPDRALIAYTNLIRQHCKPSPPIVLGGIEASLRRVAHYDFWSNAIRRSILFDAKADYLLYGMAERSILELAQGLRDQTRIDDIRGLCRISKEPVAGYHQLASFEDVRTDKEAFTEMFRQFYDNLDPVSGVGVAQRHSDRWLINNPAAKPLSTSEMDAVYDIDFEREAHPSYRRLGDVPALNTIRHSIPTHRGCYGECNFCGITVHQGRRVQWRSQRSILHEAEQVSKLDDFKGYLTLGGSPTGNMYGFECARKDREGACRDKHCMTPDICSELPVKHSGQMSMLEKIRALDGVKKVFVTSGIRHDLILADKNHGKPFLRDLIDHSISGQMKIAPEHSDPAVLDLMGKPSSNGTKVFAELYKQMVRQSGSKQFLTYYLIAAHPGCDDRAMYALRQFMTEEMKLTPEQVQVFTPLPSTWSAVMYYTERDPFTGKKLFVEKRPEKKEHQKKIVTGNSSHKKPNKPANSKRGFK
ncbi:YgiQ family radical SAM protein [bacterium]|nr:YgiQ family radical SAM protein [bacterium]